MSREHDFELVGFVEVEAVACMVYVEVGVWRCGFIGGLCTGRVVSCVVASIVQGFFDVSPLCA